MILDDAWPETMADLDQAFGEQSNGRTQNLIYLLMSSQEVHSMNTHSAELRLMKTDKKNVFTF